MSSVHAARTRALEAAGAEPRRWAARRERLVPYGFVLPLFAVFVAFYLWPALNTIASSLFEWGLLNPWELQASGEWDFVGLGNYGELLGPSLPTSRETVMTKELLSPEGEIGVRDVVDGIEQRCRQPRSGASRRRAERSGWRASRVGGGA